MPGYNGTEDIRAIGDEAGGGVPRGGRAANWPTLQHVGSLRTIQVRTNFFVIT